MANKAGAKFPEPAAPAGARPPGATPTAAAPTAAAPAAAADARPTPAPDDAGRRADARRRDPPSRWRRSAHGRRRRQRSRRRSTRQVCSACHAAGVAGAPKLGDKAAWAPRIAQGIDALTASAIKGKGAMPPKGGSNASDAEIKAVVTYMVNASK